MKCHKDHVEGKESVIPMQSCVGGKWVGSSNCFFLFLGQPRVFWSE